PPSYLRTACERAAHPQVNRPFACGPEGPELLLLGRRARTLGGLARQALARGGRERVLLATANGDPNGVTLLGNVTRVDADDHLRVTGAEVDVLRVAELVRNGAVDEGVGAELFHHVHLDRDGAVGVGRGAVERLGAE